MVIGSHPATQEDPMTTAFPVPAVTQWACFLTMAGFIISAVVAGRVLRFYWHTEPTRRAKWNRLAAARVRTQSESRIVIESLDVRAPLASDGRYGVGGALLGGAAAAQHEARLLEWYRLLHNPLNNTFAVVITSGLVFTCFTAISALLIVSLPNHTCVLPAELAATPPNATSNISTYPLYPLVCDASATFVQFSDTYALCVLVLYCALAASEPLCAYFVMHARRSGIVGHVACTGVATAATVAMWAALPVQPWGSRFFASYAWCWIPDEDQTGAISYAQLSALRFGLTYVAPVLMVILCIRAQFLLSRDPHEQRYGKWHGPECSLLHVHTTAVRRRFAAQVALVAGVYLIGSITRFFHAAADDKWLTGVACLCFQLLPGGNALLWGYGEGFLRAAVRRDTALEACVEHQCFSQIVLKHFGMDTVSFVVARHVAGRVGALVAALRG